MVRLRKLRNSVISLWYKSFHRCTGEKKYYILLFLDLESLDVIVQMGLNELT